MAKTEKQITIQQFEKKSHFTGLYFSLIKPILYSKFFYFFHPQQKKLKLLLKNLRLKLNLKLNLKPNLKLNLRLLLKNLLLLQKNLPLLQKNLWLLLKNLRFD